MATRTKTINDSYTTDIMKQEFNTLLFHSTGKKLYLKSNPLKGIVSYCVVKTNEAAGSIINHEHEIFQEAVADYNS